MHLTAIQRRAMVEDGYLVVRGAVAPALIDAARRAINHSLGSAGLPPDDLPTMRAQSYCPELREAPLITDLFNRSPLLAMCESMLGSGNVLAATRGQIALRFPTMDGEPAPPRGHIDGTGTGTNGIPAGQFVRSFTALVTILLADVPEPYSGNFTVWPGTHRFFERVFRERGAATLAEGIDGVELPSDPVQVTGRAGDAVISHHQLVHTAAPNVSPNIRYAVIFRVRHKDAERHGVEAMTDIWREWPGVSEFLPQTESMMASI